jgi:hypothetical protein
VFVSQVEYGVMPVTEALGASRRRRAAGNGDLAGGGGVVRATATRSSSPGPSISLRPRLWI